MSTTVHSSEQILTWLLTSQPTTRPTAWFVALHTGDPTNTGASNEVNDANYVRQAVTFSITGTGLRSAENSADVVFPAADQAYTVSYVSVWDASSGGNALAVIPLELVRAIGVGGVFSIPTGQLVIGVTPPTCD